VRSVILLESCREGLTSDEISKWEHESFMREVGVAKQQGGNGQLLGRHRNANRASARWRAAPLPLPRAPARVAASLSR
jgi:hypothetical protein